MGNGRRTETVSFSLQRGTVRRLRQLRAEGCVSVSRVVQAAIEEYLGKAFGGGGGDGRKGGRQWVTRTG